jgi:hypothetical protein
MKCLIFGCDHEIPWTPWLERAAESENHKSGVWSGVIDPPDNFDNGTDRSISDDTVRSGPNYTQSFIDQSFSSFNRMVLISNNKNITLVPQCNFTIEFRQCQIQISTARLLKIFMKFVNPSNWILGYYHCRFLQNIYILTLRNSFRLHLAL